MIFASHMHFSVLFDHGKFEVHELLLDSEDSRIEEKRDSPNSSLPGDTGEMQKRP